MFACPALARCTWLALAVLAACGPEPASSKPDAAASTAPPAPVAIAPLQLGPPDRVLVWTPEQQRDGYANMDRVFPTRVISRERRDALPAFPLPVELRDLSQVNAFGMYTIEDFRKRYNVAGMLVIKRGKIVYEHYAHGHGPTTRWTSWSVAKSVVSLLVGAALHDGFIRSLDDALSDYVHALGKGPYAQVTIRNLLEMKSGVSWNEDYLDPQSDVSRLGLRARRDASGLIEFMNAKERIGEPGASFNYNTGETYLLGLVVRAAISNNLASYLSRTIWSRFAMESDGYWMLDAEHGDELGGCCMSATLRDYGRLGLFALRNGRLLDGTPALADGYAEQATRRDGSPYGYLWWLNSGSFSARGIYGQEIRVFPADDLVIVTNAFSKLPVESFDYAGRLFEAIRDALH